jgi:hypothetical protein
MNADNADEEQEKNGGAKNLVRCAVDQTTSMVCVASGADQSLEPSALAAFICG